MFDLDGHLPQLPVDTVLVKSSGFSLFPDNADSPALTDYWVPESSFGPNDQMELSWVPMQFRTQRRLLEAAGAANVDWHELTQSVGMDAGAAAEGAASVPPSPSQASQGSSDGELINARASSGSSNRPVPPSARCQWANLDGQSCGRVFALGNDLHEHLKAAHSVKSEVFCRWVGCCFGVLGDTPHQYAYSVERHTWGHSGYRPYKCPTCSEGFAAANVRDEHFTNLHLKRKTFSCDTCTHQCTSATNLKRHKDDKHRTERFQCEFCNRNGKMRLFPRGPNLARHFRKCKYVLAQFPEAISAATGKIDDDWLPNGYRRGHHGMDRAKVTPPNYLPVSNSMSRSRTESILP
ncbi:MAG: zinc-finger protein [Pleopsidium flavum]|nr:MAG: zinc-finger protein [Pleopsidium flavum]